MMNLNQETMREVIAEAFDKTGSLRWQMAITRAAQELESNPFMHYDGHALIILSESNEVYSANGSCQCKAFAHGKPCWHRAAARLVTRYNERSN
jgi:hypothetical protein